ncbi:MAG: class I SAM-dependent methyltransferase [Dehalococcoidia bacterium]
MSREYDQTILEHYNTQAQEHGLEPTSTMLDVTVRQRETALVQRFVGLAVKFLRRQGNTDEITVCDVGCGNGSTLQALRDDFPNLGLQGIEFTPALRELAQTRHRDDPKVRVSPGDVRDLKEFNDQFDIVVCQRVLINLLDAADQQLGLRQLARIARSGGFLLSIEAFDGPLANLNDARGEFGYPPLPPAYHNLYLPTDFYSAEPALVEVEGPSLDRDLPVDFLPHNFLSSHFFVSRVLHPLALGPEGQFIRNSHFVRFFTEAFNRPVGDYAPIKAHAFRKL